MSELSELTAYVVKGTGNVVQTGEAYATIGSIEYSQGGKIHEIKVGGKGPSERDALENYKTALGSAVAKMERLGKESKALPVVVTIIG